MCCKLYCLSEARAARGDEGMGGDRDHTRPLRAARTHEGRVLGTRNSGAPLSPEATSPLKVRLGLSRALKLPAVPS